MLSPGAGLMKSNHLTNCDVWKIVGRVKQVSLPQWKETCFPTDLKPTSTVATSAYARDLTTLSPSSSYTFPRPSAVPPALPPTTWRSHTTCGSYATCLLTDGLPSMLLISLRLVRSGRTPLLRQTSLRDNRWLKPLFLKKSRQKKKVQFYSTYFENKDRWSPQGSSSFSKGGTNTGFGEMMCISRWLYKWRVPIPPPSFLSPCECSDETLLSHTCNWEQGLVWVIWPTSSWMQPFASPHVGSAHLNIDVSVTSCLEHRSLQRCQRSQLDCLRVVQTPETWERRGTALKDGAEKS